jgi:hypothetical protein
MSIYPIAMSLSAFTWAMWHKLHETITHNHQCRGMANLLARMKHFMDTMSPFPGNGYDTTKV